MRALAGALTLSLSRKRVRGARAPLSPGTPPHQALAWQAGARVGVRGIVVAVCGAALFAAGCRQDMHDQPRYKPYAKSGFFDDGRAARPLVEGTVARGQLRDDARLYTGKEGAGFVEVFPVKVDLALLERGRERYDIFCAPCHGRTGRGNGLVVQRGFRAPKSFHEARLRHEKPGYFFDVITRGFGAMPDYASQIPVPDRWAVVAYLRALQLSQHATFDDVPAAERAQIGAAGPLAPTLAPVGGAEAGDHR